MTVEIELTGVGADVTLLDLYSNIDGFMVPFETNVPVASLLTTYSSTLVPDGTATIRVKSVSTLCKNYLDINLVTTTTSTTTI